MTPMPNDKNNNNTAPQDLQRAIENLVDQGFSQAEIRDLIAKIDLAYTESANAGQAAKALAEKIEQMEATLQRPLTEEEKDALRREMDNKV